MSRFFPRSAAPAAAALLLISAANAQTGLVAAARAQSSIVSAAVPGRLVVVYRNGRVPANADALVASTGARAVAHLARFGMSSVQTAAGNEDAVAARLKARPEVAVVLNDLYVRGHAMLFAAGSPLPEAPAAAVARPAPQAPTRLAPAVEFAPIPQPLGLPRLAPRIFTRIGDQPSSAPLHVPTDTYYTSPQGWAVQRAGGYGNNIAGGASAGPWTTSMGAGIRIAIVDSGVDANHPDIRPNLALNLSDVDQSAATGEPSPCDDGSPQDQSGHGTWAASLAAGAYGPGTGNVVGVAPQATILNIKVLERLPAASGATLTAQCQAGQPGGLLSWVLKGIEDAVANHADIVSLSLGTIVDLTTGSGAGWKAQFDSVTYAAAQSGTLIVAAAGNDGLNLSGGRYIELPAQARGVLPVVAATNPACAENLATGATCAAGPVTRPYYSNYGATLNAIAAPGGSYPEGTDTGVSGFVRGACSSGLTNTSDGLPANGRSFGCFAAGHAPYVQAMGTSASAPLIAGAAAVLRAAHRNWTPAQTIAAILTTGTKSPSMTEPQLNLAAALAQP